MIIYNIYNIYSFLIYINRYLLVLIDITELFLELKVDCELLLDIPVFRILSGNAIFGSVGHLGQN